MDCSLPLFPSLLSPVGAARFDSVPGHMAHSQPVATIVDQADVLGWQFEHYCVQADEWVSVALLTPDATAATLRQQYGEIHNVSEVIVLDPSIDGIAAVRDQLDPLGWRFETCSDQTDEWTELIELDPDCTEDQLREHHEPIRNLCPLGDAMTVAQAVYDREEPPATHEPTGGDGDAC